MNSMPQHAVTNGYRNIEYLRPQLSSASTFVVWNESAPWRRNSSARAESASLLAWRSEAAIAAPPEGRRAPRALPANIAALVLSGRRGGALADRSRLGGP